jgi:hypothetical protein
MNISPKLLVLLCLTLPVATLLGCARAAENTTGFTLEERIEIDAAFEPTWQAVKGALREMELDIYTRDKRGVFVAHAYRDRQWFNWFTPERIEFSVQVRPLTSERTAITVEAVRQVYGVTLMTYPDWHDRPLEQDERIAELLARVRSRLGIEG